MAFLAGYPAKLPWPDIRHIPTYNYLCGLLFSPGVLGDKVDADARLVHRRRAPAVVEGRGGGGGGDGRVGGRVGGRGGLLERVVVLRLLGVVEGRPVQLAPAVLGAHVVVVSEISYIHDKNIYTIYIYANNT